MVPSLLLCATPRTTTNAQFCALPAEGARIAASSTWVISSSGTGSGLNRRSALAE
jgi:hypothetical protein